MIWQCLEICPNRSSEWEAREVKSSPSTFLGITVTETTWYEVKMHMQDANKTYILKVKLKHNKRIYRVIELLATQTLDDLHHTILKAYSFDSDHLYSFFMDNKRWSGGGNEYCSPHSEGRHADKVTMHNLHLLPKHKFLYLYDYGDEWQFEVEFLENGQEILGKKYPRIIKKVGESPEQYG